MQCRDTYIGTLDIAMSVTVGYNSRMVRPLSFNSFRTAGPVVDIHTMRMYVADVAMRAERNVAVR